VTESRSRHAFPESPLLNRLPLKKECAYFPSARNSHTVIICRDVKNFEAHRAGKGVVRQYWAKFVW
jgi:hypothetical protein